MPNLKDFVEAMNTSWPVALAILIGSAGTLVGEAYGIEYLQTLPNWLLGTAFLLAMFSGAVLTVAALRGAAGAVSRYSARKRRDRWRAEHVEKMRNLPPQEVHVLVWAAAQGTQVFLATINAPELEPLIAKGYVEMLPGSHSILEWPYRIPEHIWKVIVEEVKSIPEREKITYPFR